eukprot:1489767-Ditylum_brightwellii.AAC.1
MDPAKYATRSTGVAYTASSTHQGTYNANTAANSGSVVQSWCKAENKQRIEDHMIEKAELQVCKNKLQEALLKWLLSEIEDCNIGLNFVSLKDIFDHAYNCRGQIDDDLVDEYTNNFNEPINMTQGFNTYQPITDQQLSGKGQLHVGQTGIFWEKYLAWKRHPVANKTWNDFKTTKDTGFGANATVQNTKSAYHNFEEAIDNLAYAATTSNNVVEELVKTNSNFVEQLKAAQEENSRLLKIIGLSVTQGRSTAAPPPPSGRNWHNRQKINYE